jgi:hypothetical protein
VQIGLLWSPNKSAPKRFAPGAESIRVGAVLMLISSHRATAGTPGS